MLFRNRWYDSDAIFLYQSVQLISPLLTRLFEKRPDCAFIDNVADGAQGFETTVRYIRAVQLQRDVRPIQFVHKFGHK